MIWLLGRGGKLRDDVKIDLVASAIEKRKIWVAELLEEKLEIRLPGERMTQLLEWAIEHDEPFTPMWLFRKGAEVSDPSQILENICLLYSAKANIIHWIRNFPPEQTSLDELKKVFWWRASWVCGLLRTGASIRPHLVLLLLFRKSFGEDDERVTAQCEKCNYRELESLFPKRINRVPRAAFSRLQSPEGLIVIQCIDGSVRSAPRNLLRSRSGFVEGFLRFHERQGGPGQILRIDYEAKYVDFMLHYINRPQRLGSHRSLRVT